MTATYRGIGDEIAKGVPLRELWAEMLGKATGTSKGRGGPMHIADPDHGLMLCTGIVGGGLPVAIGLGLASQLQGDGRVTICNFGDGATNIGAFHESLEHGLGLERCRSSSSARTTSTASTPSSPTPRRRRPWSTAPPAYAMKGDQGRRRRTRRPPTTPPARPSTTPAAARARCCSSA